VGRQELRVHGAAFCGGLDIRQEARLQLEVCSHARADFHAEPHAHGLAKRQVRRAFEVKVLEHHGIVSAPCVDAEGDRECHQDGGDEIEEKARHLADDGLLYWSVKAEPSEPTWIIHALAMHRT